MAVTITLRPGAMVGWKRIVVTVGAPDKENTELESVRRLISFQAKPYQLEEFCKNCPYTMAASGAKQTLVSWVMSVKCHNRNWDHLAEWTKVSAG